MEPIVVVGSDGGRVVIRVPDPCGSGTLELVEAAASAVAPGTVVEVHVGAGGWEEAALDRFTASLERCGAVLVRPGLSGGCGR